MGHTFLFRGEPNGRADSLAWWLSILSADAMLLSESAGGDRSLAKLSGMLETLLTERRRKGREKYQRGVAEMIEKLSERIASMTAKRGHARIYPTLMRHLAKKSQYALRLARSSEAPLVCGASALKEVSLGLSLVSDIAQLCPQYLDPSERMMIRRAHEMCQVFEDKCARAVCYEPGGDGYLPFLAEADEAVIEYRRFLRELNARIAEKRLLSVFPPSFLVWADGTCALVHRLLKRLSSGKSVLGIADEEDDISAEEVMRARALMPMTILAEHSEETVREGSNVSVEGAEQGVREEGCDLCDQAEVVCEPMTKAVVIEAETVAVEPTEAEVETVIEEVSIADAPIEEVSADMKAPPAPERIYAKASDYKNIVAKAVQKSREHTAFAPRPLGKRR